MSHRDARPQPARAAASVVLLALVWRILSLARPIPQWPPPVDCERAVVRNGRLACPAEPPTLGSLCPGVEDGERALAPGDRVTCLFGVEVVDRMPPAEIEALGLRIDLNHASAAELETLPRVGPATAARIIDGRPYAALDDILEVSGIGPKTLEGLRDRATVRPRRR